MEIKSAEFITSMADYTNRFPGAGLRQVAICGKSNVGKSSLINRLCGSNKLAQPPAPTPGKTRLINVFLLNDAFHLIDLPGYGFAKVDKQEKRAGRDDAALFHSIQGAVPRAASGGYSSRTHGG